MTYVHMLTYACMAALAPLGCSSSSQQHDIYAQRSTPLSFSTHLRVEYHFQQRVQHHVVGHQLPAVDDVLLGGRQACEGDDMRRGGGL